MNDVVCPSVRSSGERSASSRKKPLRDRVLLFTEARVERFHGFMAVLLFFFHCDYWHLLATFTCLSCPPVSLAKNKSPCLWKRVY